jgi:hypothetical protein
MTATIRRDHERHCVSAAPTGDLRGLAAHGTIVNAAFEIGLSSLALVWRPDRTPAGG